MCGECYWLAEAVNGHGVSVDADAFIGVLDALLWGAAGCSSENGFDAGDEFAWAEWLGDVVIGTEF